MFCYGNVPSKAGSLTHIIPFRHKMDHYANEFSYQTKVQYLAFQEATETVLQCHMVLWCQLSAASVLRFSVIENGKFVNVVSRTESFGSSVTGYSRPN